ncbi:receptor-type tyrosine-protein phosphatase eta-like [Pempheris klunzingeri]|uniref:receptor-type tyrosine-protein phosphatase eta-like n=1 Tax=Pempheris klunzingeri TaxID=3127111 RepID=UPI0039809FB2
MMKPLSFKITSDHLLLCVCLSLLWGATDSSTSTPYTTLTATVTNTTEATTSLMTSLPTKRPPPNAEEFKSVGRIETSITLQWKKVDDILNYTLVFNENEINITASEDDEQVKHTISELTSGTRYHLTLFTVSEDVRSSGVKYTAVTAPPNAEGFKSVAQNETSITLQWKKVDGFLNYTLVFNETEMNITASEDNEQVKHTISELTSGTRYHLTLFTLFENIRSSGVKYTAVTAPPNAEGFKSVGRNETSITLQWKKVDGFLNYTLVFNETEINITASEDDEQVKHTISELTSGTRYHLTLFTVSEDVRSSGVKYTAVTAPRNAEEIETVAQNETSITLQWKKVDDILNYTLVVSGNEINITASEDNEQVKHTISELTSGTRYHLTLFTLFENIRSSGVKYTAVTAPPNAEGFKSVGRNETSITLQWKKVDGFLNYTLVFNETEINITASEDDEQVKHTISELTSGTRYHLTLFTVSEDVRSSGVKYTAVTAPRNTEEIETVAQNETSITLQWKKVDDILNYTLVVSGNEINITASEDNEQVKHTISELTSGTRYHLTLFTLFEKVRSSGVKYTAVTAPPNAEGFKSVAQNETSITLQWKKVDGFLNYTLVFNETEINITASEDNEQVKHTISELTSGTRYHLTLFTLFEKVRSSGVKYTAVTAPRNAEEIETVAQNETSITLQWKKVDDILKYTLVVSGNEINITASEVLENVTDTILGLTSGTKYDFRLFTLFENVRSSGVKYTAVTAPRNTEEIETVAQNETSITLQWKKVDDILNYTLVVSGNEINITASEDNEQVKHTISELTSGTRYHLTLFTLFEKVRSSGVKYTAVTAPRNAEEIETVAQNETSITLQWKKVDDILKYTLVVSGNEINITASEVLENVTDTILGLTSGTKYDFRLFTLFENVRSSGVKYTAVTAPRNTEEIETVAQNETSITLQWKKVDDILNYTLVVSGNEINITASEDNEQVKHTISELTSGTRYHLTLFTLFEKVRSSGVKYTAVTAPRNAEEIETVAQNETSITLQWKKVDDILKYTLVVSGNEINITASEVLENVTDTILGLTSGTKYDFRLFTLFENVRSSGVKYTAVTAPRNTEEIETVAQNETSITLQWKKVDDILNYTLVVSGNEINITASEDNEQVKHTISELTSGTRYHLTLFTLFEKVRSSGVKYTAVTAPRNAEEIETVAQNETSITLQWKKVDDILKYTLVVSGNEINITASEVLENVTDTILGLTSGTKYDFRLFTLFENVRSSGVKYTAVTAPRNTEEIETVAQNETSITLQWKKVDDILNYTLVVSGNEINITASEDNEQVKHTISELTSGTRYHLTLFTLFENVRSSGVKYTAVTAPRNTEEMETVAQNETSITLQWKKVDDILKYTLVVSGNEINITASKAPENVTYTILGLTSGTKYDFHLFTLFENVRSSGVKYTAVTAPRNTEEMETVAQNETSITLQWKKVNDILKYTLVVSGNEINITASKAPENVTYTILGLTSGTKYDFRLFTLFENVRSSGVKYTAVTVPPMVTLVNVTERFVTSITLAWNVDVSKNWKYLLRMNGESVIHPDISTNVVSYSFTSLKPGTEYRFSVITIFSGLNSTVYEDFTVTAIDCASASWHVTNSSIQGMIEGLFTYATANNTSQSLVTPGGSNVSFTGLCPGETYEVSLVYEKDLKRFNQCSHNLTIVPPNLKADCEYWAAGYSIFIVWNKPHGVWTAVEVNVTGKTYKVDGFGEQNIKIAGFLPAKTYKVSIASLSGDVRSHEPYVFPCRTDPRGVIAGSVLAVLLFGVLVLVAVFILLKRPDIIRKKPFIGGSKLSNKKCKAISVAKFPDHFYQLSVDENRGFSQEYEGLIPVGTEQTRKEALLPENKPRNRFNNVLPYDWCRVKLTTPDPNVTPDYINASYMPGYNSNREYIATQGPLPVTVNDFWRMIWEQRVRGIVMVTNCTEGGRTKCERYWPADRKPCFYGELCVTIRSEQHEPNWTLREFRMKNRNTSEERRVKHFHFTAWPDHGVPQGTEVLIQFRRLVRQHINSEGAGASTVVHCSAGVGRTGTIIALDVLLQQLEREGAVDINGFVHKMRLSRPYMVQTESQYVFLHQCIMDSLQSNGTEENIYENADMIYVNATALRELS